MATIGQPGFFSPRLSHDSKRIAVDVSLSDGPGDLWIYDVAGSGARRFTFEPDNESAPVWSPDDGEIAYMSSKTGGYSVIMRKRFAGGQPSLAARDRFDVYPGDWSPDGKSLLAMTRPARSAPLDIVAYALPGWTATPVASLRQTKAHPLFARRALDRLYVERERPRPIYVQPFPPNGSKWQVSVDGGTEPVWRRDGRALSSLTRPGGSPRPR